MATEFSIVDIHTHVLHGLDDGPRTLEESLCMCELFAKQGVRTVVATPHLCDPRYRVSPEAVRRGVKELSEACRNRGLDLEILPGGDIRLEPELLEMLDAGKVVTLADAGKYLLIELPDQSVPRVDGLIFQLAGRGLTVILSHPERNYELSRKPDKLTKLVDSGCLVQITAASLLGILGPHAQEAAETFLRTGLVHIVASDAHSPNGRRLALGRVAELLVSEYGHDVAFVLLHENPSKAVRGMSLEPAIGNQQSR